MKHNTDGIDGAINDVLKVQLHGSFRSHDRPRNTSVCKICALCVLQVHEACQGHPLPQSGPVGTDEALPKYTPSLLWYRSPPPSDPAPAPSRPNNAHHQEDPRLHHTCTEPGYLHSRQPLAPNGVPTSRKKKNNNK